MHPECRSSALRGTGKRPATGRLESTILKSARGPGPPSSLAILSEATCQGCSQAPRGPTRNPGPQPRARQDRRPAAHRTQPENEPGACEQPDLPAPGRSAGPTRRWAPRGSIRSSTGLASACRGAPQLQTVSVDERQPMCQRWMIGLPPRHPRERGHTSGTTAVECEDAAADRVEKGNGEAQEVHSLVNCATQLSLSESDFRVSAASSRSLHAKLALSAEGPCCVA